MEWSSAVTIAAPPEVVWRAGGPGARTTASHTVEPEGPGARATLRLAQRGPLGLLVGALTSGLTQRYLAMETEGLKKRAELTVGPEFRDERVHQVDEELVGCSPRARHARARRRAGSTTSW